MSAARAAAGQRRQEPDAARRACPAGGRWRRSSLLARCSASPRSACRASGTTRPSRPCTPAPEPRLDAARARPHENTPPLWYLIGRPTRGCFGTGAVALRFPRRWPGRAGAGRLGDRQRARRAAHGDPAGRDGRPQPALRVVLPGGARRTGCSCSPPASRSSASCAPSATPRAGRMALSVQPGAGDAVPLLRRLPGRRQVLWLLRAPGVRRRRGPGPRRRSCWPGWHCCRW